MPKLISVGELIDRSWEQYRGSFVQLMSIAGWAVIIAAVSVIALAFYPPATKLITLAPLTRGETFAIILNGFNTFLLATVLNIWIFASLVRLVYGSVQGKGMDVPQAMREGKTYFWPVVFVSLLVVLILLSALLVGFGPALVSAGLAAWLDNEALMILMSFLLIAGIFAATVLCFLWTVRYFLASYALLIEDKHGKAALARSRALVQGRFWQVLARLAIPKLVFILVGVIFMSVLYYVFNIFISAPAGLNIDVQVRLNAIAQSVFPIIVAALLNPLMVIADVLLYESLKRDS